MTCLARVMAQEEPQQEGRKKAGGCRPWTCICGEDKNTQRQTECRHSAGFQVESFKLKVFKLKVFKLKSFQVEKRFQVEKFSS